MWQREVATTYPDHTHVAISNVLSAPKTEVTRGRITNYGTVQQVQPSVQVTGTSHEGHVDARTMAADKCSRQ